MNPSPMIPRLCFFSQSSLMTARRVSGNTHPVWAPLVAWEAASWCGTGGGGEGLVPSAFRSAPSSSWRKNWKRDPCRQMRPGQGPHRHPPGALPRLTCTEGVEAGDGWVSAWAPSASLASSSSSSPSSMVGVSPVGEAPGRFRGFRPGPWGVLRRRVSGGRWVDSG